MYSWRSPSIAAEAIASSLLVVLPIAKTTTTGFCSRRALTIPETRSIAPADSTELPPNFITIMQKLHKSGAGVFAFRELAGQRACPTKKTSVQHPFGMHQLGIEHGSAGRAANGVVTQGDKFIIQHRTRSQPPDESRHAALAFRVLARLRPVALVHVDDGPRRRARQVAVLGHTAKSVKGCVQFGHCRLGGQLDRNRHGVAVYHCHSVAMGAHGGGERLDMVAAKLAHNLL